MLKVIVVTSNERYYSRKMSHVDKSLEILFSSSSRKIFSISAEIMVVVGRRNASEMMFSLFSRFFFRDTVYFLRAGSFVFCLRESFDVFHSGNTRYARAIPGQFRTSIDNGTENGGI